MSCLFVSDEAGDGALRVGRYQTPGAGELVSARRRWTDRSEQQRWAAVSRETGHRPVSAVPLPVRPTLQPQLKEHLHVYGGKHRLHHYRWVRCSFLTNMISLLLFLSSLEIKHQEYFFTGYKRCISIFIFKLVNNYNVQYNSVADMKLTSTMN